jgi:uncharacterized membrane protein
MERVKLSEDEKFMMFILNGKRSKKEIYEFFYEKEKRKKILKNLKEFCFVDYALHVSEDYVDIKLTKRGKEYLKSNPNLYNPGEEKEEKDALELENAREAKNRYNTNLRIQYITLILVIISIIVSICLKMF